MRLTCPNCKAQYEVEDSVIPAGGRDVQCSSCASTWFQYPAGVALQMRATDLDDDDDEDDAAGDPPPRPAERPAAAPGGERRVDRTVLDVLRQEAEREMTERRRDRPAVETQAEMGLVNRPRPKSAEPAPRPSAAAPAGAPVARAVSDPAEPGDASVSRRGLLPDIDELSSTLEPRRGPDPQAEDEPQTEAESGRDFRRGLSAAVMVAAVLVGLYLLAPQLAELMPALAGPLAGYVALVDSLRQSIAGLLGTR